MPTRAIYRCLRTDTGERTVSYDPECNNPDNTNEGRLGFTISVATLGRYLDSVEGDRHEGDHFTTTGGVGPAYHFQGNLGFLLNQHLAGTVPLYSCNAHGDQFLSRAADCEGAKQLGLVGWAYAKPPTGIPTGPIYRCRRRNGERFVSAKATCRRSTNVNEGRLGYVMLRPLGR
jgi:hypothetical protein